jgi:hypothetical protein
VERASEFLQLPQIVKKINASISKKTAVCGDAGLNKEWAEI